MPKGLEATALFFAREDFPADQRRQHQREERVSPPSLSRKVGLGKSAQIPRQHFVAHAKHDRGVITVRLHVSGKTSGAEIASQKPVACAVGTARQFFAWHILRDLKRQRSVHPHLAHLSLIHISEPTR